MNASMDTSTGLNMLTANTKYLISSFTNTWDYFKMRDYPNGGQHIKVTLS